MPDPVVSYFTEILCTTSSRQVSPNTTEKPMYYERTIPNGGGDTEDETVALSLVERNGIDSTQGPLFVFTKNKALHGTLRNY